MITRRNFLKTTALLMAGLPFARGSAQQRPLMLAHFMPWYQSPAVSGYWGWHWTMDHFDPTQVDENGRPQIASHYTPLTGPYDSSDEAVLEYQVMLMKLSGVDGVIVDWYGTADFNDYAANNRATHQLFKYTQRAGLKFAICYEDRTVKAMVDAGVLTTHEEAVQQGVADMQHLQEHWFSDPTYLTYNSQPVLLVFGPIYFRSSSDWETMLSDVALITLDNHRVSNGLTTYPWPPMMGGITYNHAAIEAYLNNFYRIAQRSDYVVGGAFPAFHDIYEQAGVESSYGYLDAEDGDTFRLTLGMALEQNPDMIQLITWNDYGEGTIIEPTEETGYQYLEILQETSPHVTTTPDDLRLPLQVYNLRKQHPENSDIHPILDRVVEAVFQGKVAEAHDLLRSVG
jgi:hypothetical protein